jgi:2-iminobutanoate/2-iminopropanoate deaminase
MKALVATLVVVTIPLFAADRQPVVPAGVKIGGAYTPGILSNNFLYVSGQGAEDAQGSLPKEEEAQIRQCLANVKTVVLAAGLTMENVVYVQVYLTHYQDEAPLNRVWKEFFPTAPPARSTIGVAKLNGTPVEMSAVAVRDLSTKVPVVPPGYPPTVPISPAVRVGNRLYLSGFLGRDINTGSIPEDPGAQVELSFTRLSQTLKAAGADFANLVFVNPYLTDKIPIEVMNRIYAKHFEFGNTPARATIKVAGLPSGANFELTGVAVLDLSKRRAVRPKNMEPSPTASPCVFADDTFYCSAKSGFIPGVNGGIYASTVETQMRQTMRNLLDGLEEAGMNFSNVVSSNVYLDDVSDFSRMNSVYLQYFNTGFPARTTVQQIAPGERSADAKGHWPTLEQISIIAVK